MDGQATPSRPSGSPRLMNATEASQTRVAAGARRVSITASMRREVVYSVVGPLERGRRATASAPRPARTTRRPKPVE